MKNKSQNDTNPAERRKALERDLNEFLRAGNQIQYIDDGVSAQDPQGKGRQLRLGRPEGEAKKPSSG